MKHYNEIATKLVDLKRQYYKLDPIEDIEDRINLLKQINLLQWVLNIKSCIN